jgi:modulator of FtsH protease
VYAYDPSEWTDLFVAAAGATAALAGLLFVAVSINLDRILKEVGLPDRALETVMLLVGALVVSIIGLIPGQSDGALGFEIFLAGLLLAWLVARLQLVYDPSRPAPRSWLISRWGVRALSTVPLILGGASLMTGDGGGLYWVVAGIVFAIVGAVANAWVLLVEILR